MVRNLQSRREHSAVIIKRHADCMASYDASDKIFDDGEEPFNEGGEDGFDEIHRASEEGVVFIKLEV